MRDIKRYIALFLLAGFLFPQAANSLHYFVISHNYSSEDSRNINFSASSYDYHSCEYQLNGLKYTLPPAYGEDTTEGIIFIKRQDLQKKQVYTPAPAYHYSLRGPPEILFSAEQIHNYISIFK